MCHQQGVLRSKWYHQKDHQCVSRKEGDLKLSPGEPQV